MARLIDAYALEDEFGISDEDLIAKEAIRAAPTVDAVEVVRCRDCKHYKPQKKSAHWEHRAYYCNRIVTIKTQPYDFCSCGERKGAKMDEEVSV